MEVLFTAQDVKYYDGRADGPCSSFANRGRVSLRPGNSELPLCWRLTESA